MEDALAITFFFLYGLGVVAVVVLLIVFGIRRIEAKKKETFEDRDN